MFRLNNEHTVLPIAVGICQTTNWNRTYHANGFSHFSIQPTDLTEFDEVLVRRWFKQITVYEDHYTVELKSGLSVDIDAE